MNRTIVALVVSFLGGWALWTLAEYLLHRFAMHHLRGRGIMSREHLEHHVHASWTFSRTHLLSWTAMLTVGALVWFPLGWLAANAGVGAVVALGWAFGYFFYEYQHAMAHRRAPTSRYSTWLRRHHFHHHFGHPLANHGVSVGVWDHVFGTNEQPEVVRVPRRLAPHWLVDDHGELRPELLDHYVLVGDATSDERLAALDRARAFASVAPAD